MTDEPRIPDGTLMPAEIDGAVVLLVREGGQWLNISTGLPPPQAAKPISVGYTDRHGT